MMVEAGRRIATLGGTKKNSRILVIPVGKPM